MNTPPGPEFEQLYLDIQIEGDQAEQDTQDSRFRRLARAAGRRAIQCAVPAVGALLGAGIALSHSHMSTEAAGVKMDVTATTVHEHGLSADTIFGNISYPRVDGLPLGFHVTPVIQTHNVQDLSSNSDAFLKELKKESVDQIPRLAWHFGEIAAEGAAVGAVGAELLQFGPRLVFPRTRRKLTDTLENQTAGNFLMNRGINTVTGIIVCSALVGGYGKVSYNPDWSQEAQMSGLISDAFAFPAELNKLYANDSDAATVTSGLLKLEHRLSQPSPKERATQPTAVKIMTISDDHFRDMFPYILDLAERSGVDMIINTGDEDMHGNELAMAQKYTAFHKYIADLTKLTSKIPMIWESGNHDSPATVAVMKSIPNVTVLGDKIEQPDGTYDVTAQTVQAYGLNLLGVADARVYGAPGAAGAEDDTVTDKLNAEKINEALKSFDPKSGTIDAGLFHEPNLVPMLQKIIGARIMFSGHTHQQNSIDTIQQPGYDNLVEGSTGMGGLAQIDSSPMEFSILNVAPNCQFTKVVRYMLSDPSTPDSNSNSTIQSLVLNPQKLQPGRFCSTDLGIGKVQNITARRSINLADPPRTRHAIRK